MRGLVLALMVFVSGCGGSSSETPPPLEPDPQNLYRGTGAPFIPKQRPQPAVDAEGKEVEADDDPQTRAKKPVPSTWGDPASRDLK
jgi:hypothetical protein